MPKKYQSIQSFSVALGTRIRDKALATGVDSNLLRRRYVIQVFLARLFRRQPHDWLVKGGTALAIRYSQARFTSDVDLMATEMPQSRISILESLEDCCGVDDGDPFIFNLIKDTPITNTPGWRYTFRVWLGPKIFDTFWVDVVFGIPVFDFPERHALIPEIDINDVQPFPNVLLYPLSAHVADKIAAIIQDRGEGMESSRYRDLFDLIHLLQTYEINSASVTISLAQLMMIPNKFRPGPLVVPAAWRTPYERLARRYRLPPPYDEFDAASKFLWAIADPIIEKSRQLSSYFGDSR